MLIILQQKELRTCAVNYLCECVCQCMCVVIVVVVAGTDEATTTKKQRINFQVLTILVPFLGNESVSESF